MSLLTEFNQAQWGYNLQVGDQVVIMGMVPMTRKYSVTRVTDTCVVACTLRFSRETGEESPKPGHRPSYHIISPQQWERVLADKKAHSDKHWWRIWMTEQIGVILKHCPDALVERVYTQMKRVVKEML